MCNLPATAGISGAHLNPAVTVAIVSQGGMDVAEAGCYMAAQVVGAAAAAGFNFIAFSGGIAATEAAAGITRGACAASAGIFSGAFGMVPNALVCKKKLSAFSFPENPRLHSER